MGSQTNNLRDCAEGSRINVHEKNPDHSLKRVGVFSNGQLPIQRTKPL